MALRKLAGMLRLLPLAMLLVGTASPLHAQDNVGAGIAPPEARGPSGRVQPPAQHPTMTARTGAVLRALDKVTGRVSQLTLAVDEVDAFGTLNIRVRACYATPPEEFPEAAAFIESWELPPGEREAQWVYSGWMFASSPSLAAMDHAVYDIWVIACSTESVLSETDNPAILESQE